MSAPTTAQDAALAAIVERRARRRADASPSTTAGGGCSSTGSTRSGLETFEPRGAFYAFPRITLDRADRRRRSPSGCCPRSGWRSCPGNAFGPSGEGHVRMCYATSYEQLEEALRRIGRFVERVRAE